MMSGISILSDAIADSRAFSAARSGEPGRYVRLGSLVGDTSIRVIQNANLIAFVSKAFDFGFRFDLERDTDAEPVSAFARLSEGNIDVTNELTP